MKSGIQVDGRPLNEPTLRDVLALAALQFVWVALCPRLARRMRVASRLGPRGLAAYVAFNTAGGLGLRAWAVPELRRVGERQQEAERELTDRLGRPPTREELIERLRRDAH